MLGRVFLALVVLSLVIVAGASGERHQRGNPIVSLDGELSPLQLPRDRLAPVAVRLEGGLRTDDGTTLPRVTQIALSLPTQASLNTRGLPRCSPRQLRFTTTAEARRLCGRRSSAAARAGWGPPWSPTSRARSGPGRASPTSR